MKKIRIASLLAAFISLLIVSTAFAQGEGLTLKLSRDFGYGGFNNDIQGTFSMKVTGPDNLARVEFYIDATMIGEVTQAPFNLQFVTDNYPLGTHSLSAVGFTADGQELRSNTISANFVSASEGNKATAGFLIPVLVVVAAALLLSALVPLLTGRKKKDLAPGTPRQYTLGGGICPRCGRPFPFNFLALKLGFGRVDRCPYCGRYGFVRSVSMDKLRKAEQAELENAKATLAVPETSEEDKLRKDLDNSKYEG
jgi:hypothetical protein